MLSHWILFRFSCPIFVIFPLKLSTNRRYSVQFLVRISPLSPDVRLHLREMSCSFRQLYVALCWDRYLLFGCHYFVCVCMWIILCRCSLLRYPFPLFTTYHRISNNIQSHVYSICFFCECAAPMHAFWNGCILWRQIHMECYFNSIYYFTFVFVYQIFIFVMNHNDGLFASMKREMIFFFFLYSPKKLTMRYFLTFSFFECLL